MDKNTKKFNFLLISALVYTLSVSFTLKAHETSRIFLYRLLNASFLLLLLFFNYNFIIDLFSLLYNFILKKVRSFIGYQEEEKKEEDKVRAFIENSLRDKTITNPMVKDIAPTFPMYTKSQPEKEILRSNAKVDFRTLSNINERKQPFPTSQKESYSNTSNIQYYFSQNKDHGSKMDFMMKKPNYNWYDKEKTSQFKKINLLKSLIMNNKKFVETLDYQDRSDSIDEQAYNDAKALNIANSIDHWKNNFKDYLISYFLPGIISDHEFNINSLNNYLRTSLNINFSERFSTQQTNNFYEVVDQKFSQFNFYNLSQPQNIVYDIDEEYYLPIFYTEDNKISYLIKKIEEKILSLKMHQKPISTKKIESKVNKPFYFTSNDFTKITEDINYNNAHLEDHLNNIKNLLVQRIMLNKRFTQRLIKEENQYHSMLMEYYFIK